MSSLAKKKIFRKLENKSLKFGHVAEVGVYLPETSNILDFILDGVRTTLVEPDARSLRAIDKFFKGRDNITVHPVAVCDKPGKVELLQRDASTFLKDLDASPAIVNDDYQTNEQDIFSVQAVRFDEIDDGTIDLLSIDIEGGEWFVLKHMKSRPAVLSIETHGAMYVNPHIEKITEWVSANNYIVWFKDRSDTVFVRADVFLPGLNEKLALWWIEFRIVVKRYRKLLKKKIRKLIFQIIYFRI